MEEEIRYVRSEPRQVTALQERPEDVVFTGLSVEEAIREPSPPLSQRGLAWGDLWK